MYIAITNTYALISAIPSRLIGFMKVFAVTVNQDELKWSKGSDLKNFPIPMPREYLDRLSEYCRERGINRCEWARRVLIASFGELDATEKRTG